MAFEEPTCADRADWAEAGLFAFAQQTNQDKCGDWEHDKEIVVSDFLADLHHFCDRHDIDIGTCMERGRDHYQEEKREEAEDDDEASPG